MPYYKDQSGKLHYLESSEFENLLPDGCIQITEAEAEEIKAAVLAEMPKIWPRFFGNEKLDLFTMQEQLAVVDATMTDPLVKLMYDRLLGAAYLTYEEPETEQGLSLLVDKNLLTPERKSAIVALMQPR